jgi:hypothetical protein
MMPAWICFSVGVAIVVGEQWELLPLFIAECSVAE